jgi:hypothetical protein
METNPQSNLGGGVVGDRGSSVHTDPLISNTWKSFATIGKARSARAKVSKSSRCHDSILASKYSSQEMNLNSLELSEYYFVDITLKTLSTGVLVSFSLLMQN